MEKELTSSMKELAEVFSIKHRTASGNAVVDLALLNVHGIIDRILTNDLEALSQLCTQTRVFNCNFMEIAVELTWLGFADLLLKVAITMTRTELKSFIPTWHAELIQELAVPSDTFSPSLARFVQFTRVSSSFPDVNMLLGYTNPTITISHDIQWSHQELSLPTLASLCECYFEWGWKSEIVKHFWMIIWPLIMMHMMQQYVMAPEQPVFTLGGTFARSQHVGVDNEWILRVTSSKEDPFFNEELLYYVKVNPRMFVYLVEASDEPLGSVCSEFVDLSC